MIDDDDVDMVALAWPEGGAIITVVGIVVIVILALCASSNDAECAKQPCARGKPQIVEGQCVCVEPTGATP